MGDTGNEYFTEWNESSESFDQMNLHENLLRGIYAYGFEKPSAIQQKGIVPFGKGLDVIQQAQSGTGKTATFCAGILQVGAPPAGAPPGRRVQPGRPRSGGSSMRQQHQELELEAAPGSLSMRAAGGGGRRRRQHPDAAVHAAAASAMERQQRIWRQRHACSIFCCCCRLAGRCSATPLAAELSRADGTCADGSVLPPPCSALPSCAARHRCRAAEPGLLPG